jgi:hypothetical protein
VKSSCAAVAMQVKLSKIQSDAKAVMKIRSIEFGALGIERC